MTEHDPICTRFRRAVDEPFQPCICGELREARANEREMLPHDGLTIAKALEYDRLRAKVETLPGAGLEIPHGARGGYVMVRRADVLALLDESRDE